MKNPKIPVKKQVKKIKNWRDQVRETSFIVSEGFIKRRRSFFLAFLIIIALAFAELTVLVKQTPYFPVDLHITLAIQRFTPFWFDFLMKQLTNLGSPVPSGIIITLACLILLFFKKYLETIWLLLSTLGGYELSLYFKGLVARHRPSADLVHQVTKFIRNDSFPSGHVLFYVSFFGFILFLTYTFLKKSIYKKVLVILYFVLIILIGPSRIYLGAHWFSDTMGAYLLGTVWLSIVIFTYYRARRYLVNRLVTQKK
jgi:membrane-associated phospholipid phosphatase